MHVIKQYLKNNRNPTQEKSFFSRHSLIRFTFKVFRVRNIV